MKDEVRAKINALNYNGTAEEQHEALHSVLLKGIRAADLRETVIERLTTEDMEELIQFEHCAGEAEPQELTQKQKDSLLQTTADYRQQFDDGLITFEEWHSMTLLELAKQFK